MEALQLKIVVLTPWWPSKRAPTSGAFCEVDVRALGEAGHIVRVVAVRLPGWLPRRVRDLLFGLIAGARLAWAWSRNEVEVIHAYNVLPAGLIAAAFTKYLGVPSVLVELTCPFVLHLRGAWSVRLVQWVVDHVSVTAGCGDELAEWVRKPREVVGNTLPCCVDVPAARPLRHFGLRILCSGAFHPRKGFDLLPQIWAELSVKERQSIELVCLGAGPMEPLLRAMPGLATVLPPAVNRESWLEWLQWSDLVLCPSRQEGMGLVAAEAAALGKLVLASPTGIHRWLGEVGGAIVKPRNAQGWAETLRKLLQMPAASWSTSAGGVVRGELGPLAYRRRAAALYQKALGQQPASDGNEPHYPRDSTMKLGETMWAGGAFLCVMVMLPWIFLRTRFEDERNKLTSDAKRSH